MEWFGIGEAVSWQSLWLGIGLALATASLWVGEARRYVVLALSGAWFGKPVFGPPSDRLRTMSWTGNVS